MICLLIDSRPGADLGEENYIKELLSMGERVVRTSISPYPSTLERIKERGGVSPVIERDINRLYDMYSRALRQVSLTGEEACLIVDCLNGAIHDANSAPMMWASVADGIELDGLGTKWNVDGPALVDKLIGLTEIQSMAIIDAAERFWVTPDRDQDMAVTVAELFMIK